MLSKNQSKEGIHTEIKIGVKIDNQKIIDWQKEINIKDNMIIQVGKRKFIQIKV